MAEDAVPGPGATTDLAAQSEDAEAAAEWRETRYRRWQQEQQHADPGLRPALLRLALASLLQPRLAADAPAGTTDLPGDVVGAVGDSVETALRFCGELTGHAGPVTSAQFSPEGRQIVSGLAATTQCGCGMRRRARASRC